MVAALVRPHPLSRRDQIEMPFPTGHTLAQMVAMFWPDPVVHRHVVALVGDVAVPPHQWALVRPKEHTTVRLGLTAFEGGGGGGGKNVLALVATIALAMFAPVAAGWILGAGASPLAVTALAAGITMLGSLAIAAIFKPPMLNNVGTPSANPADAQTYSITGQANQATPYGPMLRVYGRHRIFPRLAAVPFTTTEGTQQFIYMLLDCGYGPLQIEDLKIGDTPILRYRDVLYRVHQSWRAGDALEYYRNDTSYETMNLVLATEVAEIRLSAPDASGIVLDFALPRGLISFDDRGNRGAHAVSFDAYVRPAGSAAAWQHIRRYPVYVSRALYTPTTQNNIGAFNTYAQFPISLDGEILIGQGAVNLRVQTENVIVGDVLYLASNEMKTITSVSPYLDVDGNVVPGWKLIDISTATAATYPQGVQSPILRTVDAPTDTIIIVDATPQPILFSITVDVPAGAWEVQVIRRSAESTTDRLFDELVWATIRSLADRPPIAVQSPHTIIELKIRASEQLSGVLQDVNCIATSILPVYDPPEYHYLSIPNTSTAGASTPDNPAVSITGNHEFIFCGAADNWFHPTVFQRLINKGTAVAATTGYRWILNSASGFMQVGGSNGVSFWSSQTSVAPPFVNGQAIWLRVTVLMNNGAGQREARFFYSQQSPYTDPADIVWTQLGATIFAAIQTLQDVADPLMVGSIGPSGGGAFQGKIFRAQVYNGIGGTLAADFNPARAAIGAASFVAASGETWTLGTLAKIKSDANPPPDPNYFLQNGTAGPCARSLDSVALSVTGDIDIRACIAPTTWTPATFACIVGKWWTTSNQLSWTFRLSASGAFQFVISTTGADFPNNSSTAPTGFAAGSRHWVRVTRVQSTGVTTFYTSEDGFAWTQLGATVIISAGVAMFDSTSPLQVGAEQSGGSQQLAGKFYRVRVLNGINGVLVADFDPSRAIAGSASFVGGVGETWSMIGAGAIVAGTPQNLWVELPTRNPAWAYVDVLRGSASIRPLADSRIDYANSIKHWADYCDIIVANGVDGAPEARVKFDHVVDYSTTTYQLLQSIAAAGRATPAVRDGKHGVIVDEEQTTPVQMFTPRNSWGFNSRRTYLTEPHALRAKFVDPENQWQEGNVVIYASGYDASNATTFEDLKLFGVTRYTQATRDARYMKAQALLRREEFSINCDLENLIATRGDLVLVQHDVLEVGGDSARIIAVAGDVIQLSDPFGTLAPGSYGVRIRLSDGTITAPIAATPIAPDSFDLALLPTPAPAVGDLVAWGFLSTETGEYLVKQVAPGDELSAQLTLAEIARAVYDADTGVIPPYLPPAGGRPVAGRGPAVVNLRVEQLDITIGREPYADLVLAWEIPQLGGYAKYRIGEIANDGVTVQIGDTHLARLKVSSLQLLDPSVTVARTFVVVGIDMVGKMSLPAQVTFTPRNPLYVPGDAQFLSSNAHDKTTTLTWFAPNNPAVPGNAQILFYEVRYQPTGSTAWGTASRVTELVPWNVTTVTVPSRNGSYLVKAITSSGVESSAPAVTVIAVEDLVIQDIWSIHRFSPAWDGVFDNCEIEGGLLQLTPLPDGTFPAVGVFYPHAGETFSEIVQCRISSMLAADALNNTEVMAEWIPLAIAAPLSRVQRPDWAVSVWVAARETEYFPMSEWIPLAIAAPLVPVAPIFSTDDWRPLLHGEYIARDLRFAVVLESFVANVTPRVSQAGVDIDFPERAEEHADIVVPAGGLNFVFDRPFAMTPSVAIDLQDADPGDYVDRSLPDSAGFSIFVRDSVGAGKAGVVDVSAFGVGRTF